MILFQTRTLDRGEILQLILAIQGFVERAWGDPIKVSHGGVSNVSNEKQFRWWEIAPRDVLRTLEEQERVEQFRIGDYDFFISNLDESERIHICHESDVHFEVGDTLSDLIRGILAQNKLD